MTVTVSVTPPISSVRSTWTASPRLCSMPRLTAFLNPGDSASICTRPGGMSTTTQRPFASVLACTVAPVCSFITVTRAPGTTPPCGSTMYPPSAPGGKSIDRSIAGDRCSLENCRIPSDSPAHGSSAAGTASPPKSFTLYRAGRNTSHSTSPTGTSILGSASSPPPFCANGAPECMMTKLTV